MKKIINYETMIEWTYTEDFKRKGKLIMITLLILAIISIVLLALAFFIGAIAMVTCGALYFAQGSFNGLTDAGAICLIVFGSLILLPSIPVAIGSVPTTININTN